MKEKLSPKNEKSSLKEMLSFYSQLVFIGLPALAIYKILETNASIANGALNGFDRLVDRIPSPPTRKA